MYIPGEEGASKGGAVLKLHTSINILRDEYLYRIQSCIKVFLETGKIELK